MNTKKIIILTSSLVITLVVSLLLMNQISKNYFNDKTPAENSQSQYSQRGNGTGIGQRSNSGSIQQNKPNYNRNNCISDECLNVDDMTYPAGELSADAKEALLKALDDEYKAQATYESIIKKLGNVRPFIMIIRAEEQHISSLKSLFDKYGIEISANPYTDKITSPETLSDACTAGVIAEVENASLCNDNLLPKVKNYEDITAVFTNLMNASQQKHLVAFERCAN